MSRPHFIFFLVLTLLLCSAAAHAEERAFTLFDVTLPQGWDGGEQQGFKSGNDAEYMLVLGLPKADGEEGYVAAVSIFVLPNAQHDEPQSLAHKLAGMQADATPPRQEGAFWTFTGTPRSQSFPAPAVTRVNATSDTMLIAIVQDPDAHGAEAVFKSLSGRTPEARLLLGQP